MASCSKENATITNKPVNEATIISVDLSSLPQIEETSTVFYNLQDQPEDVLTTLRNSGINTIRLRIWNNPINNYSSFEEVKAFAHKIKLMGLKVWITIHYSDTWADPGHQVPPLRWQGLSFNAIHDSVYSYTKRIVTQIKPDFIQIGNEINAGFLFPYGNINEHESQFVDLLSAGIKAVRDNSDSTKIIIHFAGIDGANPYYHKLLNIDYDIIGLSYYPIWHGKDLNALKTAISNLAKDNNKGVVIAETAYPFTLGWNDLTNNVVGLEEQLIMPGYPATQKGQRDFIAKIKEVVTSTENGIGFCYWGGELVAFKGTNATDGSIWENQALYDFNNKALPVINEFTNHAKP